VYQDWYDESRKLLFEKGMGKRYREDLIRTCTIERVDINDHGSGGSGSGSGSESTVSLSPDLLGQQGVKSITTIPDGTVVAFYEGHVIERKDDSPIGSDNSDYDYIYSPYVLPQRQQGKSFHIDAHPRHGTGKVNPVAGMINDYRHFPDEVKGQDTVQREPNVVFATLGLPLCALDVKQLQTRFDTSLHSTHVDPWLFPSTRRDAVGGFEFMVCVLITKGVILPNTWLSLDYGEGYWMYRRRKSNL